MGGGGGHSFGRPRRPVPRGGSPSPSVSSCGSGSLLDGLGMAWRSVRSWWDDLITSYKERQEKNWLELKEFRRKQRQERVKKLFKDSGFFEKLGFISFFILLGLSAWQVLKLYLKRR